MNAPTGGVRAVLRAPGALPLLVSRTIGSLPNGMVPLGLVLMLRAHGRSYGLAGLVSGSYSVGVAFAGPPLGRLIDRVGTQLVLVPLAIAFPAAVAGVVIAVASAAPAVVVCALALCCGATLPPLGACMRALWPSLVADAAMRTAAFAIDATLQEIAFVGGPPLLAALVVLAGPAVALLAAGLAGTVGASVFAWRARGRLLLGPHGGGAMRSGQVRRLLLTSVFLGGAFGAVEVAMPAFCEAHGARADAGILLAALAVGSAIGGVTFGARAARGVPVHRFAVAAAAFALLLVPMLAAPSIVLMALLAIVAGAPIAPAFAAEYVLLDRFSVAGAATETFAWNTTMIFVGAAAGAGAGGILIAQAGGFRAALVLAAALAAAAALTVLAQSRRLL